MKVLSLINQQTSNVKYEKLIFPDGQPHIKIDRDRVEPGDKVLIVTRLSNPTDLLLLLLTTEVLRNDFGVKEIALQVSYLLGARMDRRMNTGEPIALKVIAKLLNAQNYSGVIVYDAHSSVTETLIDRCISKSPEKFLRLVQSGDYFGGNLSRVPDYIVFPDEGAEKRYGYILSRVQPVICCKKTRDPKTGSLSNPVVPIEHMKPNASCLIIDDLCDGGGTFIQLHEALKKKNAGDIYLAVSHGIFSKGFEPLKMFKRIFTTNSYREQPEAENLTTIKLW